MRRTREQESERAAFYEQHRDDTGLWGEPAELPATKHRRGLGSTITVRFSAEEAGNIRRVAGERGVTYSEVVRDAVNVYTWPRTVTISVSKPQNLAALRRAPHVVAI